MNKYGNKLYEKLKDNNELWNDIDGPTNFPIEEFTYSEHPKIIYNTTTHAKEFHGQQAPYSQLWDVFQKYVAVFHATSNVIKNVLKNIIIMRCELERESELQYKKNNNNSDDRKFQSNESLCNYFKTKCKIPVFYKEKQGLDALFINLDFKALTTSIMNVSNRKNIVHGSGLLNNDLQMQQYVSDMLEYLNLYLLPFYILSWDVFAKFVKSEFIDSNKWKINGIKFYTIYFELFPNKYYRYINEIIDNGDEIIKFCYLIKIPVACFCSEIFGEHMNKVIKQLSFEITNNYKYPFKTIESLMVFLVWSHFDVKQSNHITSVEYIAGRNVKRRERREKSRKVKLTFF